MSNRTVTYVSKPLDTKEAQDFYSVFFDIDLSKLVKASVIMCDSPNPKQPNPDQGKFIIELSYPWNEFADFLVRATFKDGMMRHWGWSDKFTKKEEDTASPA